MHHSCRWTGFTTWTLDCLRPQEYWHYHVHPRQHISGLYNSRRWTGFTTWTLDCKRTSAGVLALPRAPSVVGRRSVCTLRHGHSHHVQIGHILEHWRGIHRRKLTRHCVVDNTVIRCIKHNTHRLKVLDSLLITFERQRRMSKTPESLRTTMAKLLPC